MHRDLKPSNIFLQEPEHGSEPLVKVIDFGLAKKTGEDDDVMDLPSRPPSDARLTRVDATLGTPLYMAPEQIRAPRDVDGRADIYALGVVLYEMLSQKSPFHGSGTDEVMANVIKATPVPLGELKPKLGSDLCAVVMKAMAGDPRARYLDAASFRQALKPVAAALVASEPGLADPASQSFAQDGLPTEESAHLGLIIAAVLFFGWVLSMFLLNPDRRRS